jgi:GNAT superfamily N-acetyltransferase
MPPPQHVVIAEVDGTRAGCVSVVAGEDPAVARLRVLLVTPAARGLGLGSRLVGECVRFARDNGYTAVTLWTVDILTSARRIYERFGFTLTGEEPHHTFGHPLTGQTWTLDLA